MPRVPTKLIDVVPIPHQSAQRIESSTFQGTNASAPE